MTIYKERERANRGKVGEECEGAKADEDIMKGTLY
jgi:hypothetical protein